MAAEESDGGSVVQTFNGDRYESWPRDFRVVDDDELERREESRRPVGRCQACGNGTVYRIITATGQIEEIPLFDGETARRELKEERYECANCETEGQP